MKNDKNVYLDDLEKEIIDSTKMFAINNKIHFDELTETMILNAIREYKKKYSKEKE